MANAFTTNDTVFGHVVTETRNPAVTTGAAGLFKSISARLSAAHQRRVDADVGRFIESHGGHLTDEIEREISRRYGTHAGQW